MILNTRPMILLAAAGAAAGLAQATLAQGYVVQCLDPLPGGTYSGAYAINSAGVVVGQGGSNALGASRPVRWVNGAVEDLGVPPPLGQPYYNQGWAVAVDEQGRLGGTVVLPTGETRGFAWQGGQTEYLALAPGRTRGEVNARSGERIVGYSYNLSGSGVAIDHAACLWSGIDWQLATLNDLGGGSSVAMGINSAGLIGGWARDACQLPQSVIWQGATSAPAPLLGEVCQRRSRAWTLSETGQAGGITETASGDRGFVSTGASSALIEPLPGLASSNVRGLNSLGEAVGWSYSGPGPFGTATPSRAFRWRSGELVDLNSLAPPDWVLREAWAVNDAGVIVGRGQRAGQWRGFIMRPCAGPCPPQERWAVAPADLAATGAAGDSVPFASTSPYHRYQQVYGAGEFATLGGRHRITQVRFRPANGAAFPAWSNATTLEVRLSTTPRGPDQLSTSFADNVGPDEVLAYAGPAVLATAQTLPGGVSWALAFDISLTLQTPFEYDPTRGHLLLEVRRTGGSLGENRFLSARNAAGDGVSRVFTTGTSPTGTVDSGGLVTLFVAEPVAAACSTNCDQSTIPPILNVNDFICFQTRYAASDPYANCDGSTIPPVLNVNDFICFQTQYAAGCP